MTGSRVTAGNLSHDRPQPVPHRAVARPPVPCSLDGLVRPLISENTIRDRWIGRRRTRPAVPNPSERTPHLTDQPNPSHGSTRQTTTTTSSHRSDNLATLGTTDKSSADTAGNLPDPGDGEDSDRLSHPGSGTPVSRAQTAARPTRHRKRGSHAGQPPRAATANLTDAMPTPEQWAQEQLKHAPPRSRAWARKVAAIYGLDLPEE